MRIGRLLLCSTMLTAGAALIAADASAQTTWRLTHNTSDETTWQMGAERFRDLLEERSDGAFTIDIHPNAALAGGDQMRQSEMVGRGEIEFVITSAINITPLLPEFAVFSLPYLYADYDEVDRTLVGEPSEVMAEIMADQGLVHLAWGENGFRQVTNSSHPITSPEDLQGLTMRVAGPMYIDVMEDLGANPQQMQWTEVFSALQQGVIDGQENPIGAVIIPQRVYEVQDYITLWNYSYDPLFLAISEELWDELSEDEREMVKEAATEAMAYQIDITREHTEAGVDRLIEEGMEVYEPTDEEIEAFRDAVQPSYDKWRDEIGPEVVEVFERALGR